MFSLKLTETTTFLTAYALSFVNHCFFRFFSSDSANLNSKENIFSAQSCAKHFLRSALSSSSKFFLGTSQPISSKLVIRNKFNTTVSNLQKFYMMV